MGTGNCGCGSQAAATIRGQEKSGVKNSQMLPKMVAILEARIDELAKSTRKGHGNQGMAKVPTP
jgi:hypothetical protein